MQAYLPVIPPNTASAINLTNPPITVPAGLATNPVALPIRAPLTALVAY